MITYRGPAEAAEYLGLSVHTIKSYVHQGRFATPDAKVGRVAGWLDATLDEWAATRPGQGARTDLAQPKKLDPAIVEFIARQLRHASNSAAELASTAEGLIELGYDRGDVETTLTALRASD